MSGADTVSHVNRPLSRKVVLGYGLGAFGTTAFGTVPGLLLAIYLTDDLAVSAGLASLIVLLPKVWDVVFMPFVGRLSDRTATHSGSRAPLLLLGGIGLALSLPLMFAVPRGLLGVGAAIWVLVAYTLAATAYALYVVPFTAMSAEITGVPSERTSLLSWRVALQAAGIITFGVGAPLIRQVASDGPWSGYALMGLAVGLVSGVALIFAWQRLRRIPRVVSGAFDAQESVRDQLREAWHFAPLRLLLSAFALQAVAAGAVLAGLAYYATYVLELTSYALVFGVLLAPVVITMPVWSAWGRRRGKRSGYLLASTLFLLGVLASPLALVLPASMMLVILAAAATGYGGMQMYPLSMLPDAIDDSAAQTGVQRAGGFTGVWVAVETVCFAIGPAIFLATIALGGFVSTSDGGAAQPAGAIAAILVGFGVIPTLLVAASLPLIRRVAVG